MDFGSVCSGIEAASVAWQPLGFKAEWFSEIEPYPCALLNYRYPETPNLGNMLTLPKTVLMGAVSAPSLLVGGTPCQAFSVAGMREGLADERGALTIKYVELADAIDFVRTKDGKEPAIVVWENVPGVLSSKDNAFGCFLGALAGEGCELQPAGKKWSDAGCVYGPRRAIAWRVLDAQYFGLAQRRRRVFVVASARNGFDPAAVLFERDSVRRDSPPSRGPRQNVAALTANGVGTCGADDNQAQAGHLIASSGDISHCLNAGGMGRIDFETETMIVHGNQDPSTSKSVAFALGRNNGQENAIAIPLQEVGKRTGSSTTDTRAGIGIGDESDPMYTLQAGARHGIAMSVSLRGREGGAIAELGSDVGSTLRASGGGGDKAHVLTEMAVRRLTPRECERLQGFPDDYTLVPVRGKPAADGPRYKALGNSMAVPVMRWIGARILDQIKQAANDNNKTAVKRLSV